MPLEKTTDVRTRLQAAGVFWDANNPQSQFSGALTCDGKHIELQSSAELVATDARLLHTLLSDTLNTAPDVAHGFTTQGDCTLLGLQETSNPSHAELTTNRAVCLRNFRVWACVFGALLDNETAPQIDGSVLIYSGLADWLPGVGTVSWTADSVEMKYPTKLQTILDLSFQDQIRIRLEVAPGLQLRRGPVRHIARTAPRLVVEPKEPKSLQWFLEKAYRFESFFSLCLGTSVRLQTMSLKTVSGQEGWLLRPRRTIAQKPDIQAWIRTDSDTLMNAIIAWLSNETEFQQLEKLVYGTLRHSSMFVETEFLTLAQAIEAYHRLRDSSKPVTTAEFKKTLRAVCQAIKRECNAASIEVRLIEGIRHANDIAFQDRVRSLLSRVTRVNAEKLLGDLEEFERALRQTRNHLTHFGIRSKPAVITNARAMFFFNQKLHALLRLLLLLDLGLKEKDVFDMVYYQSRKWK